jgi:hypothetical protein
MVQVYLPLGYPQLNDTFQTLVFQGNVARLYTVPTDPRTDNQVFERKLLSDVSKMRGIAGKWAKSAWKINYGTRWATIIYQMVRGDVDGIWSGAKENFQAMSEPQQQAWRNAAPFQVTYNDPGEIFFALATMIYEWDHAHAGHRFYEVRPDTLNAQTVRAWWLADLSVYGWPVQLDTAEDIDDRDPRWTYSGSWNDWNGYGPLNNTIKQAQNNGDYATINVRCTNLRLVYGQNTDCGTFKTYINGQEASNINANGVLTWQLYQVDIMRPLAVREFKIVHTGGVGQRVNLDALKVNVFYVPLDADLVIGTWALVPLNGGLTPGYWHTTGAGAGGIEFNFVGAWLALNYFNNNIYGVAQVFVDDILISEIDMYVPGGEIGDSVLLGRFKFGVHHVRIVKKTAANISLANIKVMRSKKEQFI